jgi:putative ABC transport system permease protein
MKMPLFRFLFRKMWNNRWLTLSSLIGLIVAVSFTTSIPMYADGALKRVVKSTLDQNSEGMPAGSLQIRYQAAGGGALDLKRWKDTDTFIREQLPSEIGFPYQVYANILTLRSAELRPEDPATVDASKRRQMAVAAMPGLMDHADLISGQTMSAALGEGGLIDAVVYEEGAFRHDLHLGDIYEYPVAGGQTLRVRIAGIIQPHNAADPFWYQGLDSLANMLLVSEELFIDTLLAERGVPLQLSTWYYAFDLSEIQTSQISPLSRTLNRLEVDLYQMLPDTRIDISFAELLKDFRRQSIQLQTMLFMLAVPMIAMVFYYIGMNARQALERQRTDIAVLRSRGASTRQIIRIYLLEGLLLGGIALLAGPCFGWFMAKSIGSADGFLTFVNRKSIPVGVTTETLLYGLLAVCIALISTLIPAISYARQSIVHFKQNQARSDRNPVWQRWFLDLALVALAAYGWYLLNERQLLTFRTGLTTDQLEVQPFLFFVPALAIFSIGLFFLRIFPWLLKLFNWLGRSFLPVPLYLTLTQLSRSSKAYYPLMLLLILTIGLGVYNASAARTIDLNSTERILYQYGADVIIQTAWEGTAEVPNEPPQQGGGNPGGGNSGGGNSGGGNSGGGGGQPGGGQGGGPSGNTPVRIHYSEPPFEVFKELDGVVHAARVLKMRGNVVVSGKSIGQGLVMGIDNVDFAKVAWLRRDLFPVHPYHYLSYMGEYEHAVIIPKKIADQYELKPGDSLTIALQQQAVEFAVVGILPYWPSQYPDQMPFYIANLDYIYDQIPMEPYEVWLKMEEGAKVAPLIEQLAQKGLEVVTVKDVRNELAAQSKLPTRGGVFGILSLGFLVSAAISLIGYVLYWFFNLSNRIVQFGVLRAMGLSRKQLTGMLLLEQIFTAGLSIALGFVIGQFASRLFLPFLQTAENAAAQVPPFRIVFESRDTLQLNIVVGIMMLIGAVMLFLHIRRLRVHQAVKMGEER